MGALPELVTLERNPGNPPTMFQGRAYLAECLSWGGHSGSPAFCLFPVGGTSVITLPGGSPLPISLLGNIYAFMGLVSHHYDILREAETLGVIGSIKNRLNSGIAVITPAEEIIALLNREDLAEERKQRKERASAERPATADILTARPFTKADLTR